MYKINLLEALKINKFSLHNRTLLDMMSFVHHITYSVSHDNYGTCKCSGLQHSL